MNHTQARRMVAVYETVRDSTIGFRYGIPEAVLPFSKEEIKHAILRLPQDAEDEGTRSQYVASYLLLSRFIPNGHAHRCVIVQAAMDMEDAIWLAEQRTLKDILQYMQDGQQRLGRELGVFPAGN